jgi:hypothetical protein
VEKPVEKMWRTWTLWKTTGFFHSTFHRGCGKLFIFSFYTALACGKTVENALATLENSTGFPQVGASEKTYKWLIYLRSKIISPQPVEKFSTDLVPVEKTVENFFSGDFFLFCGPAQRPDPTWLCKRVSKSMREKNGNPK